jgi:ferredoxin-NADP reductase
VSYVVSDPAGRLDGQRGHIDAEVLRRGLPANYQVPQYFICGPGAMQDALKEARGDLGVPGDRVHTFALVQH